MKPIFWILVARQLRSLSCIHRRTKHRSVLVVLSHARWAVTIRLVALMHKGYCSCCSCCRRHSCSKIHCTFFVLRDAAFDRTLTCTCKASQLSVLLRPSKVGRKLVASRPEKCICQPSIMESTSSGSVHLCNSPPAISGVIYSASVAPLSLGNCFI